VSALEEQRQKNPDGHHCIMLQQSPTACNGCPNNPYNENRKESNDALVEIWGDWISYGLELVDLVELGLIDRESELAPEEVMVMRQCLHYRRMEDMELQANMIASRMYGGKKTE